MLFLLAVGTLICIDLLRNGNSWNIYGEMFNHHHSILFFSQQQTSYLDLFYRPVKMKNDSETTDKALSFGCKRALLR